MAELIKESNAGASTISVERDLVELAAALAKANYLYRRLSQSLHGRPRKSLPIPTYGQIRVIAPPDEFDDIAGEEGIVLGGGQIDTGDYTYTVLILSKQETYYLPGASLAFTGAIIRESDIYSGVSIRVVVDESTGEGRVVNHSHEKAITA